MQTSAYALENAVKADRRISYTARSQGGWNLPETTGCELSFTAIFSAVKRSTQGPTSRAVPQPRGYAVHGEKVYNITDSFASTYISYRLLLMCTYIYVKYHTLSNLLTCSVLHLSDADLLLHARECSDDLDGQIVQPQQRHHFQFTAIFTVDELTVNSASQRHP